MTALDDRVHSSQTEIPKSEQIEFARKCYTPPQVQVSHTPILGGNTTNVPESQGGLWTSGS